MTDTPTEALPMIDCSYGKPRTYDLPGRCLTCGQRFTVRRCKGDKPPLSVDCPSCECTEYSWRDLNAILAQPAAPAEGLREAGEAALRVIEWSLFDEDSEPSDSDWLDVADALRAAIKEANHE